jgi:large subunit ribosomal protein L13
MAKEGEVPQNWWLIDATDKTLGRLASEIAQILRGKKKPQFTRHVVTGDMVVVVNSAKVRLSGNKLKDKLYWSHSRHFGGVYNLTAEQLLQRNPGQVILKAVKGMLPTSKLSSRLLTHLKVYPGSEHPHQAQKPQAYKI